MPQDEPRDDERKEPSTETGPAAGETPDPSGEEKPAARKKSAEPRDHKEPKDHKEGKDHLKLKTLRAEIEELKKNLETREREMEKAREDARGARTEAGEWKEKALRTLAETDNMRKRLEREKSEYMQFALADVLKDILHVIDNFERALKAPDAPEGYREGIELIWKQMSDLVAKRGVTPIPETDGKFDPSFHHALTTEETEGIEEPLIGEMLQKGYMLNDRLLRPALVKVLLPKRI